MYKSGQTGYKLTNIMESNTTLQNRSPVIALVEADGVLLEAMKNIDANEYSIMHFKNGIDLSAKWTKLNLNIVAVISRSEVIGTSGISMYKTLQNKKLPDIPFFIHADNINNNLKIMALKTGIADVFLKKTTRHSIRTRLMFIINNWAVLKKVSDTQVRAAYRPPIVKRIVDILFSSFALLMLSPFFLLIIIAIKLESKGPVFFYSLRVGTGSRIFKFFKFRSMYVNGHQRLQDLKHFNQIKEDPRITKVGKFLHKAGIDELPQLLNVLIGDMSIVGNRPLSLYEAEKLAADKLDQRFTAPAGITGLWQVEKCSKDGNISEEERLVLDNTYAENYSFLNDFRLILRTIPVLFQKENV